MTTIADEIVAWLPDRLVALVREAGALAAGRGESAYLVGGVVRDVLLGRRTFDVDLTIEGDALAVARRLGKRTNGKVAAHPRFGTATIRLDGVSVDFVTARSEVYASPGALPAVAPGTIIEDLARRDFTINAMAAHLDPDRFGELVDPHGGQGDIRLGLVRVLHDRSFTDDPTRIWRAVRYEQRLGFRLEQRTEDLLRRDTGVMVNVSGDRLRHEIDRILQEERPEDAINRASGLGVLEQIATGLRGNGWLAQRFAAVRRQSAHVETDAALYIGLMGWRLKETSLREFAERLRFSGNAGRILKDLPGLKRSLVLLEASDFLPSATYRLLEPYHELSVRVAALATRSRVARQRLNRYLTEYKPVDTALDGDDLKAMGVPEGRQMGRLLRQLKEARLDGKVTSSEDEERLVRRWLARSTN